MKKIITILGVVTIALNVFAQAPQRMSYQAVVRNSENALITNSPVGMKVSILQNIDADSAVYVETHSALTNENGLLNIEIGGGSIVSGTYHNGIFWAGGPYFIKTEIDPSGGTNYTLTTTSELLAVPYALYAHNAGYLVNPQQHFAGKYIMETPEWDGSWIIDVTPSKDFTKIIFSGIFNIFDGEWSGDPNEIKYFLLNATINGINNLTISTQSIFIGYDPPFVFSGTGSLTDDIITLDLSDGSETLTFVLTRQ